MRALKILAGATFLLLMLPAAALAQTGIVMGTVTDAATGDPLPGANVLVQGTGLGAATDNDGEFRIANVPVGVQTVIVSYIGYETEERTAEVSSGEDLRLQIDLQWAGTTGEEVVVTAQARGQNQAINEQLSSQTITNVVSEERIRELPDESAATAVSRLPGVSLQEGDKIVIRGIQAKLNTITVNGIQLPSTDLNDRSTNLGFISSNMLSGIEVRKAVTPAMDANSIGGTINLKLKEAPEGFHGDAMIQGDYNTQDQTYQNYRAWASVSNRFFDDKVGAFLQGNARRFDGGQDVVSLSFAGTGADPGLGERAYQTTQVDFADQLSINEEYGGSLMLDYRLPQGKLVLQNTYAASYNNSTTHYDRLYLVNRQRDLRIQRDISDRFLLINALQGEYIFSSGLRLDGGMSHARSQKDTDLNYALNLNRTGQAFADTLFSQEDLIDFDPASVYNLDLNPDAIQPALEGATRDEHFSERRLNANLNLTMPFNVFRGIAGSFQFGGKIDQMARENDVTRYYARLSDRAQSRAAFDYIESIGGDTTQANPLQFGIFRDTDYTRGDYFLAGERDMSSVFNTGYLDTYMRIAPGSWNSGNPHFADSHRFDYLADERLVGTYAMVDFNIGERLNVLTGVRYENFAMDYTAPYVFQQHYGGEGAVVDTLNVERSMDHWFPNLQLRYNVTDWFDVRLAFTKTLSRPDYAYLLPNTFVVLDSDRGEAGNPYLDPTVSQNLDAYLSFYTNKIGLFTVGGFYKRLEDVILPQTILRREVDRYDGVYWVPALRDNEGDIDLEPEQSITTYLNNQNPAYLRGIEIDWQTNFWYLPNPLNSLVFNVNYTWVDSEMDYFQLEYERRLLDPDNPFSPDTLITIETSRTARLLQQGTNTVNVALGADIGGFSGRVSFRFQGNVVTGVASRPEEDTFKENVYGLDFTLKQALPLDGLVLFFNGVNITHASEEDNRYYPLTPGGEATQQVSRIAYNPRRFQLGVRYSF